MIRKSRIRCKACNGALYWKSEEKRYVCSECGLESEALPTWNGSAQYRTSKIEKAKEKRAAYIQEILGNDRAGNDRSKKKKRLSRDEQLEEEWKELIEDSKNQD